MNRIRILLLLLLLVLLLTGPVLAQVSPSFDLGWHLLSGGGGLRSSSQFQIEDALGQWANGPSQSDHYQIDPGFWPAGAVTEMRHLYLPVMLNPGS